MITRLTGIGRHSVHGQPTFEQVVPGFLKFVGSAVLVAHNASFDKNMLNAEFVRAYGRRLANPYLCTVRLGRMFAPGLPSYRLDVLAAHFHILITNRHRALGDADATAEVLVRLLEHAAPFTISEIKKTRVKRSKRPAELSC
jgi:DNA polymerase-3 subunit epsilon